MTAAIAVLKQLFKVWPTLRLANVWRDFWAMTGDSMAVRGASSKIKETLLSWPDVAAHPHRFGGTEYRIGKREIGHIHGDWLVDIPFPTKVRNEIIAADRAQPHHILPDSGWISFYLREPNDVERAIELFRQSYEIALKQKPRSSSSPVVE
jgi:hypothetical protein